MLEVNNVSSLIATLCMSQEWPDSLVGDVFGRHISYYSRSRNTQIFVTPLYVSHEGPSSLFIGVCSTICKSWPDDGRKGDRNM